MLSEKAKTISQGLSANHGLDAAVVGSSPFIDFILQLLKSLLPMLLTCLPANPTPAQTLQAAQNLGPLQRFMMRRRIRRAIDDQDGAELLTGPIDSEVRRVIAGATEADMQAAMAEVS